MNRVKTDLWYNAQIDVEINLNIGYDILEC